MLDGWKVRSQAMILFPPCSHGQSKMLIVLSYAQGENPYNYIVACHILLFKQFDFKNSIECLKLV